MLESPLFKAVCVSALTATQMVAGHLRGLCTGPATPLHTIQVTAGHLQGLCTVPATPLQGFRRSQGTYKA